MTNWVVVRTAFACGLWDDATDLFWRLVDKIQIWTPDTVQRCLRFLNHCRYKHWQRWKTLEDADSVQDPLLLRYMSHIESGYVEFLNHALTFMEQQVLPVLTLAHPSVCVQSLTFTGDLYQYLHEVHPLNVLSLHYANRMYVQSDMYAHNMLPVWDPLNLKNQLSWMNLRRTGLPPEPSVLEPL